MKILIVDDQISNRMIAKYFVESEGHVSIEAADGQQALDMYREHTPDLILMDILMPVMDGYDAAFQIKSLVGDRYVPIIFLTAKHDEESLQKCLECGGDDYLLKPINGNLLKAKIKAHARTQDLTQQVLLKNGELGKVYAKLSREYEMGMKVLSHTLERNLKGCPNVRTYMSSMSAFNGDVFLLAENPQGGLYIFLGDFTGHGLSAAIGTIPLSQLFFSLCEKGEAVSDIVRAMNLCLKNFLPTHMFCSATFVHLFERGDCAHIWAGGLPDAYVVRAEKGIVKTIPSQHLPLGILDDTSFNSEVKFYRFQEDDRLIILSDGILEGLSNETNEMYGEQRLKTVLNKQHEDILNGLIVSYQQYIGSGAQEDDISLVEITAKPYETQMIRDLLTTDQSCRYFLPWTMTLNLDPQMIRISDVLNNVFALLPSAIRVSYRFDVLRTLISELYTNALEHGLLKLDSKIKSTNTGFAEYYRYRDQSLAALTDGFINMTMSASYDKQAQNIRIKFSIVDSGKGFDYKGKLMQEETNTLPWGRGIGLIKSLSDSLAFYGEGNHAEIIFSL